jgi:acyl carrier protein
MKSEIKQFIISQSAAQGNLQLRDDESLLDTGVIDSSTMMELILFLETKFRIKIDEDEMTPENFDTINAITALVARKSVPSA